MVGYFDSGICKEGSAEELIFLGKSLEENVENPLGIGIASVRQQRHLREHYYHFS